MNIDELARVLEEIQGEESQELDVFTHINGKDMTFDDVYREHGTGIIIDPKVKEGD